MKVCDPAPRSTTMALLRQAASCRPASRRLRRPTSRGPKGPLSAPERVEHLLAKARRKALVGDPVVRREPGRRHVEGAEDHIEDREGRRIVLLAANLRRAVVPAVE